jgi:transposase
MSNFRRIDRQTVFLMPPSVDEWLPEPHFARFVVEIVEGLDLRAISRSYPHSGSAPYRPTILLSLLVYGYATGFSPAASWNGRYIIRWRSASSPARVPRP